jgi:hypothetical protein
MILKLADEEQKKRLKSKKEQIFGHPAGYDCQM